MKSTYIRIYATARRVNNPSGRACAGVGGHLMTEIFAHCSSDFSRHFFPRVELLRALDDAQHRSRIRVLRPARLASAERLR